jgi:HEAT repeat protein
MPGITYLFKQALQHPDADVRRAAVVGLTKTAGDSDLPAFEAALGDRDPGVCEAAVRGLAYLGTDAATRLLARLLVEGDETLSLVAAEALARCGAEGADLLHQSLELEDMMARRAGVFGLARIGARPLLEKAAREDDQWIVRSAAVAALEELEEQEKTYGVAPPLEIDQLPWLVSWAATQGEGVGLGEAARHMLRRALTEGDAQIRVLAARVLAQAGRPDDIESLRTALATTDRQVIDAVLEALAQISERYALSIAFN